MSWDLRFATWRLGSDVHNVTLPAEGRRGSMRLQPAGMRIVEEASCVAVVLRTLAPSTGGLEGDVVWILAVDGSLMRSIPLRGPSVFCVHSTRALVFSALLLPASAHPVIGVLESGGQMHDFAAPLQFSEARRARRSLHPSNNAPAAPDADVSEGPLPFGWLLLCAVGFIGTALSLAWTVCALIYYGWWARQVAPASSL
jgi:hypothetical protein